ncbi:HxlR family transcriptional regulator [Lacticaseibacillus chiayiensis]|uniref:Helix-turn-helix transcriptional regulator n=1 Tax=Lacticaseibacillus chiayiensis TaxID=2100821 RepID=A0A4Q1TJD6_9LACO|nr:helix-turn-helix domain-containing protein [Lacticaseibacillus chiayiensis]QVI35121.1 helix-turn-helix transcriptional regulator [Lacticaseibacillus chiayiensis]RXT17978.1 HxlR family transcriptional regulator [Lacticaseibacillus chiayiensis]UYN56905.1 helix-turn-helix transcriptional regulator [Lacticaseibacillus chiayiensis]
MARELYNCAEGCPVQNTVDLISGKWKSVILYHLFKKDATRFSTLNKAIPSITERMLALQLAQLEDDGIIFKKVGAEDGRATEYGLTKLGQTLAPVIDAMAAWGRFYQTQQAALA